MPRNYSAAVKSAITAEVVRPIHLARLDFDSGLVRVTDAPFSVFYDDDADTVDEEFLGVGALGGISAIEETTEGKVSRITLTLTGVAQADAALALNGGYHWRPATLWRAYLDADHQVIDAPEVRFKGFMDTMPIRLAADGTAQLGLTIVNRFARWERPLNVPRWSNEDHQSRRPGDKYFENLPAIANGKEVKWGRT